MNYLEAIEATVSRQEAKQEIEKHCLNFQDFINEVGNKLEYKGAEVLNWLGY